MAENNGQKTVLALIKAGRKQAVWQVCECQDTGQGAVSGGNRPGLRAAVF